MTRSNSHSSFNTDAHLLSPAQAVFYACTFFFIFCLSDAAIKYLLLNYNNKSQILCAMNGIGLILIHGFAVLYYRKGWLHIYKSPKKKLHFTRMGLSIIGSGLMMIAISAIPLTNFYGLIFTAPFFSALLAHFALGEHIGWRRWGMIALGFCGVLVTLLPELESKGEIYGYLAALGCATCFSINALLAKKIGKEKSVIPMALYPMLGVFLFNLPMAIIHFEPITLIDGSIYLMVGCLIFGGVILSGYTFSHTPSISLVSPFHYTQIIWASILGWVIFKEAITTETFIGISIIILSGLGLFFFNTQRHVKENTKQITAGALMPFLRYDPLDSRQIARARFEGRRKARLRAKTKRRGITRQQD